MKMNTIKVRRGCFFFSYCSPTSFLTWIISQSAAYLAQVYVQMVEYAILKKHSQYFWKKLHKFLLEKIKRNNYFITFRKLIDRSYFYTSINFNSDITYMKNNVSISNLDNFITFEKPANAKRKYKHFSIQGSYPNSKLSRKLS